MYEALEDDCDVRKRSHFSGVTSSEGESVEDICDDCSQLNLSGFMKNAIQLQDKRSVPVRNVGFRYRERRETGCILCRMLFASRVYTEQEIGTEYSMAGDEGDTIWAASFLDLSELVRDSVILNANDTVCLLVLPRHFDWYGNYPRFRNHVKSKGCAVLLQDGSRPSMFAPQVVPTLFDPERVKTWLRYCKQNHHKKLCGLKHAPIHGLQVIDCTTLSIQKAQPDMPYVTLSYVWGTSKSHCGTFPSIEASSSKQLPNQLSPVIRDSINVTRALGFRYLWVDKFCIDQENSERKLDQIRQMDAIYKNSELTIVAAAGIDETYGLPGVGTKSRNHQLIAKNQDVTVIWMKDPHESIRSSHWSTRGWTFQEAVLSRRCLVFTEDQVYFECNAMNCFESIHSPLDSLHVDDSLVHVIVEDRSKMRGDVRAGMFGRNRVQPFGICDNRFLEAVFSRYLSNVEDYSARKLSYDEDSLNAFQGILTQLSKKWRLHNIWGLAYPGSPGYTEHRVNFFVHSLTWRHKRSSRIPRRRHKFPSWTWVGWEGEVEYDITTARGLRLWSQNDIRILCLESTDGSLIEFKRFTHLSRRNCIYTILHITAAVIPLELLYYCPSTDTEYSWRIRGGGEAKLSLSYGADSEAQFAEDIRVGLGWRFVYIKTYSAEGLYLLVLKSEPVSHTWIRAGMFCIEMKDRNIIRKFLNKNLETFRII